MKLPLAKLQAANLFASKEAARPRLNGVYIKLEKGIITLVATDGHRLIKFEISENDNADLDDVHFIIPSHLIKKIKKARFVDDVEIIYKNGKISINYDKDTFRGREIEEDYPDYEKVIPDKKEYEEGAGCNLIGFNPMYLSDFARVNKLLGKNIGIRMLISDSNAPAIITMFENEWEYIGVLMPLIRR